MGSEMCIRDSIWFAAFCRFDNEFDDRFFLMTSADDGALHWTLSDKNLTDLIAALADAVSDLND